MKFASIFLALVYIGGALSFIENVGKKDFNWKATAAVVVWPLVVSHLAVDDYMNDYKWRHH